MYPEERGLVCIVGPNSIHNQLLVSFFEEGPGLDRIEYTCLEDVSQIPKYRYGRKTMVLCDCQGMVPMGEAGALNDMPDDLLAHCRVCLFNVPGLNGKEGDFVRMGIRGIFFTNSSYEVIRRAIPLVLDGELWYSRKALAACVLETPVSVSLHGREKDTILLTNREKEILLKLVSGASNQEISNDLFISPHTVKTHIYNLFRKIGVKNRIEASMWAREHMDMLRDLPASGS